MARSPKKTEPTANERRALFVLMYDSSLFNAHPIVVTNVREGVEELLRTLGRPDLADLWADPEKLAAHSSQL
jgi:hypothetical protein